MVLRRLGPADLLAFQAYRSDEDVGRYQGWSAQTDQQALELLEEMSGVVLFPSGAWVQLAVADRKTNGLIGDIGACVAADGLSAELGITVCPRLQGQGLGTEAVNEAVALLFDQSLVSKVVCITDARNTPSIRLLERAGMRKLATAEAVFRGEPCIEHTYVVFRCDGG
ncbi:MAG: GNAT family N-acetyltransferase [Luteimonas sp.]|nr:GNAT family N-acetyltransferase [Luteimonas sp.]